MLGGILVGGAISVRASLAGGWEQGLCRHVPQALWWSSCCPSRQERPKDVLRMERGEKHMRQLLGKSSKPRSPHDRHPGAATSSLLLSTPPQAPTALLQGCGCSQKAANPKQHLPPAPSLPIPRYFHPLSWNGAGTTPVCCLSRGRDHSHSPSCCRERCSLGIWLGVEGTGLTWDAGGLHRSLAAARELGDAALEPTQGGVSCAVKKKGAILNPQGSGQRPTHHPQMLQARWSQHRQG